MHMSTIFVLDSYRICVYGYIVIMLQPPEKDDLVQSYAINHTNQSNFIIGSLSKSSLVKHEVDSTGTNWNESGCKAYDQV